MPARFYGFSYPAQGPLLRFLTIDSNLREVPAQPWPAPEPSSYAVEIFHL